MNDYIITQKRSDYKLDNSIKLFYDLFYDFTNVELFNKPLNYKYYDRKNVFLAESDRYVFETMNGNKFILDFMFSGCLTIESLTNNKQIIENYKKSTEEIVNKDKKHYESNKNDYDRLIKNIINGNINENDDYSNIFPDELLSNRVNLQFRRVYNNLEDDEFIDKISNTEKNEIFNHIYYILNMFIKEHPEILIYSVGRCYFHLDNIYEKLFNILFSENFEKTESDKTGFNYKNGYYYFLKK